MSDTYKCAVCKGTFEKGWSDAEAEAEAAENFGKPPIEWNENAEIVCDDCYEKMKPKDHPVERAEAVAKLNTHPPLYQCETCQELTTVRIAVLGMHFCARCLAEIDARVLDPSLIKRVAHD